MSIKKVGLHKHDQANKKDCRQLIITGTCTWKE